MRSILKDDGCFGLPLLSLTVVIFGIAVISQNVQGIYAEANARHYPKNRDFLETDIDDQVAPFPAANLVNSRLVPERSSRRRTGIEPVENIEEHRGLADYLKSGLQRLIGDGQDSSVVDPNSGTHYEMPIFPNKPINAQPLGKDAHGRVQMGISTASCDDAKTNLTMDWDFSPINYTCFHPETRFPQNPFKPHIQECMDIPSDYTPNHFCMDKHISYDDAIPTAGDHRPLWPVFGEYLFVPMQRWQHNIEHGAVIMLYHPCAQPEEVKRLKSLVTSCLDKHVITPSTLLPADRPLALVAWGCRLLMAVVEDNVVMNFIQQKALKGPEDTKKEGQYTYGLIKSANEKGTAQFDVIKCGGHGRIK